MPEDDFGVKNIDKVKDNTLERLTSHRHRIRSILGCGGLELVKMGENSLAKVLTDVEIEKAIQSAAPGESSFEFDLEFAVYCPSQKT